uniref:Uncharacterized protein n=1 Tax=Anguilla anguilla TaxID=7936 RepID=A0A0E9RKJ8_ANGAN
MYMFMAMDNWYLMRIVATLSDLCSVHSWVKKSGPSPKWQNVGLLVVLATNHWSGS